DLVHLVFSLTISSDGAIPVHYKTYAGNRTDDTTHIETWNTVKKIAGRSDFVYVADSKVCTSKQLTHIVSNGGRVITVMPNTYKETKIFKDELLSTNIQRKVILKRKMTEGDCNNEYFSLFLGNYETIDDGYAIYWYLSSQKKKLDKNLRQKRIKKADSALLELSLKLNKRDLRTEEAIIDKVEAILNKYGIEDFFTITVSKKTEEIRKKIGKGRPGPFAEYKSITKTIYLLDWDIDRQRLKKEERADGIFPLLSTDKSIGPKEALVSYKYQPKLEKRFNQFKSVHEAAPIFFKNIQRVEAIMFLFFVALIVQGIIERKVRMSMKERAIKSLPIYPEYRKSFYPTTSKIFYNFDGISSYKILKDDKVIKEFKDELSSIHKLLLGLLDINEDDFWGK
ncbi:MAG: IS1634 family transposase, partial [Actinobacteria bacterium]|nr:IS1634 family transposase [Actinomycetota bacterium]